MSVYNKYPWHLPYCLESTGVRLLYSVKIINISLVDIELDSAWDKNYHLLSIRVRLVSVHSEGPLWSWSYGSWIYNYLCNQCLSQLTFEPHLQTRCIRYNIMWWSLWITCNRSVVFYSQYGFLHKLNSPPRYNWNIFESSVKHHKPTNNT